MFNIGAGEFALIAVVALLVLGPKRLPELARGIGKFLREFRKQTDDVRNVVEREFYRMDEDIQKPLTPPPLAGSNLPSHSNRASANRTPASTNAPVTAAAPPGEVPALLAPPAAPVAEPSASPVAEPGAAPVAPGVPDTVASGELHLPVEPMPSQVMGGLPQDAEKK